MSERGEGVHCDWKGNRIGRSVTLPPPPGRRDSRRNSNTGEGGWAPWRPQGPGDRTGGLQGGAPWRVRGLGRPWWIWGLGRPWRIRGLWWPWRIRELWRPWWNWRPGPYFFRWVREFRGLGSAPGHPGRGYRAPPKNFLGEVPLCWALWRSVLCGALGKR